LTSDPPCVVRPACVVRHLRHLRLGSGGGESVERRDEDVEPLDDLGHVVLQLQSRLAKVDVVDERVIAGVAGL
jgi:hypothetical protein